MDRGKLLIENRTKGSALEAGVRKKEVEKGKESLDF